MPADVGSAHVWYLPVAKEDEAYEDHKDVVQEVDWLFPFRSGDLVIVLSTPVSIRGGSRLYKSILLYFDFVWLGVHAPVIHMRNVLLKSFC